MTEPNGAGRGVDANELMAGQSSNSSPLPSAQCVPLVGGASGRQYERETHHDGVLGITTSAAAGDEEGNGEVPLPVPACGDEGDEEPPRSRHGRATVKVMQGPGCTATY